MPFRKRFQYVDSIRAIAALCVLVEHVLGMLAKHMGPADAGFADTISALFGFGKFGVFLFFIVSGFVVPFSLRGDRAEGLRHFAISRIFRLFPAYWLSVVAAAMIIGLSEPSVAGAIPGVAFVNLTMLQQFVGVPDILPLYWTLGVELIFYGLCALLFISGQIEKPLSLFLYALSFLSLAFALACAQQWFSAPFKVELPLALAMMGFGTLYRRGRLHQEASSKTYAYGLLAVYACVLPVICYLLHRDDTGFRGAWYVFVISYLAAPLAFIFLTTRGRIESAALVWIGRVSYSLYLFHVMVIMLYRDAMGPSLASVPLSVHLLIVTGFSLGLSHLTYIYVEAPSIALGRRIIARYRPLAMPH